MKSIYATTTKNLRVSLSATSSVKRLFSTPVPLTPDELKKNEIEIEKVRKNHREPGLFIIEIFAKSWSL